MNRWHRPTREQLASPGYRTKLFASWEAADADGWYPMGIGPSNQIVAFQVAAVVR